MSSGERIHKTSQPLTTSLINCSSSLASKTLNKARNKGGSSCWRLYRVYGDFEELDCLLEDMVYVKDIEQALLNPNFVLHRSAKEDFC
jgi:hypothetical protein